MSIYDTVVLDGTELRLESNGTLKMMRQWRAGELDGIHLMFDWDGTFLRHDYKDRTVTSGIRVEAGRILWHEEVFDRRSEREWVRETAFADKPSRREEMRPCGEGTYLIISIDGMPAGGYLKDKRGRVTEVHGYREGKLAYVTPVVGLPDVVGSEVESVASDANGLVTSVSFSAIGQRWERRFVFDRGKLIATEWLENGAIVRREKPPPPLVPPAISCEEPPLQGSERPQPARPRDLNLAQVAVVRSD